MQLDEVHRVGANALFQGCRFDQTRFTGCDFASVCFDQCSVDQCSFSQCSFESVIGHDKWLAEQSTQDPFVAFLNAILAALGKHKRLGQQSKSYQAMARYQQEYMAQQKNRMDYANVLYDGSVPDKELTVVEKILDKVEAVFPF